MEEMYERTTDYSKEPDMTDNELKFFDPKTGKPLHRRAALGA